jgi:hypothetical protein
MTRRFRAAKYVLQHRFGSFSALCVCARVVTHSDNRHDIYEAACHTEQGLRLVQFILRWNLLHTRWRLVNFRCSPVIPCLADVFLEPVGLMDDFAEVWTLPSGWWPFSGELMLGIEFQNRSKCWAWNFMTHLKGRQKAIGNFAAKLGQAIEAAATGIPNEV